MKKGKLFMPLALLFVSSFMVLASCSPKEGPQGEQGVPGEKGDKGDAGVSITGVSKTSSDGLVDTYTITFSDGTKTTFTVTNGKDGAAGAAGAAGAQGEKGDKGDQGDKGDKGDQGDKGDKGDQGDKGDKGDKGDTGNGIESIAIANETASGYTLVIKYTNGQTVNLNVSKNKGIKSIALESSLPNAEGRIVDTYKITYTDDSVQTFTVTNGKDGQTPYIGENGNWWIGDLDTNVSAYGDNYKWDVAFNARGGEFNELPEGIEEGEDDDEGNHVAIANDVKHGDYISELPVPEYGTHSFQGWWTGFTVNDGQFTTLTSVTKNLDLVARWSDLTVTYVDGNGEVFTTQSYTAGQPLAYPTGTTPPKAATANNYYDFVGWNVPAGTPVSYDFTVTAVYNTMATVTFKNGDGSDLYATNVVAGEHASFEGAEPTKASSGDYSYSFNGNWYTTPELDNLWDLENDVVNNHMTLYPEFDATYKGLFTYTVDEDTLTAQITGLDSTVAASFSDTVASIPDTIMVGTKTYTVTSIGDGAFKNVAFPTSVEIVSFNDAKHLVSIGNEAFRNSSAASYAVGKLPDTVADVGSYAFNYVKTTDNAVYGSLLDLEDTALTTIRTSAFAYIMYGSIVPFTLSSRVTTIQSSAFYNCDRAGGDIPDLSNVTTMGTYAFYGSYILSGVVNLSGLTAVPAYAFHGRNLGHFTGVILNDEKTTSIGSNAFQNQPRITYVEGTSSLTMISANAFASDNGLKSFLIPASCTTIGSKAFNYAMATDGIIYCEVASDLYGWASDWHSNSNGQIMYNAVASGEYVYSDDTILSYIIRPDNSLVITEALCEEATLNLTSGVEIDGETYYVQEIGPHAFENCTDLVNIYIRTPKNSRTAPLIVGDYAFAGCTQLTRLYVNTVSNTWSADLYLSVGAHAFDGDAKVTFGPLASNSGTSIYTINKFYLESIGEYAFNGCIAVNNTMTIRNNVGAHAFDGCIRLAGFDLVATDSQLTIGEYAFNGCTNLARVNIQANWKVNSYAFNGCTGLRSAWIFSGAIMSGDNIFYGVGIYDSSSNPITGLLIHCNDASAPASWSAIWNYNDASNAHITSYGESF